MKGTSGFQEVRSSPSRSPAYRLLHEQRPQFGTGFWPLLRTHDLIAFSTGISTKREKVPDTIFMPNSLGSYKEGGKLLCQMASVRVLWQAQR
jgi:hypothetical protein